MTGCSQQKPLLVQTPVAGRGVIGRHTFVAAPHWLPAPQVPHEVMVRVAPQVSVISSEPHVFSARAQRAASDSGMHTHWLEDVHVVGLVQLPQLVTVRVAPQLSAAVTAPHWAPTRVQKVALVSAVQPQTLAMPPPPPQVLTPPQLPQSRVRVAPQLSVTTREPQFLPRAAQRAASD